MLLAIALLLVVPLLLIVPLLRVLLLLVALRATRRPVSAARTHGGSQVAGRAWAWGLPKGLGLTP